MRRNEGFFPVRRDRETGGGLSRWDDEPGGYFAGSPWQMMRRMQEDMDRLFGQFFGGETLGGTFGGAGQSGFGGQQGGQLAQARQAFAPSIDISQSDREWVIEVDLPGVDRDNIDVQVQNNHLILSAELRQEEPGQAEGQQQGQLQNQQQGQRQYYRRERRYGFFQRVLPLPDNAEEENISCEFRNGVLTVTVPKSARAQQQGRRIPIGEGAGAIGRSIAGGTTGSGAGARGAAGTGAGTARTTGGGGRTAVEEEEETLAGTKGGERRNADATGATGETGGAGTGGSRGTGGAGTQGTTGGGTAGGTRNRGTGK